MLRTLFRRLFFSYLLLTLAALAVIGLLIYHLFHQYYVRIKEQELLSKSHEVASLVEPFLRSSPPAEGLNSLVDSLSAVLGARICVIDRQGRVVASACKIKVPPLKLPGTEEVLRGRSTTRHGHPYYFDEPVTLIALAPVVIRRSDQIVGGVVVQMPLVGITSTIDRVQQFILYAALASIPVAALLAFWLSSSISRPLQEMRKLAAQIAEGDFHSRLEVSSVEEVGQLARSFNALTAALERNIQAQRQFVADVSHELRTPLTSMQGFLEALLDGTVQDEEATRRYLHIILQEAQRLSRLISDLLDLSRMESGRYVLQKQPVDLNEIVQGVLWKLQPQAEAHEVSLTAQLPEEPLLVFADPDRLEQVITNLTDNAIRFNRPQGRVSISLREKDAFWEVQVTDTGQGIPPEELPHVWERFHKVDKSRSRGGTGLGLAIVKHIVEAHGGTVQVTSKVGEGSTFTFTLPAAVPSMGESEGL
ncbi:MAG TPA: HAMP domain-containing protein [Armatimonadetes bacterium]|nr:HAMP domain-containing protein [Armatimonadota bacterium]